jgi:hypothetical protein
MPTTKNARATTAASTDGDALQFWCVTFSHLVRHQLNRIMSLPHMHTAPPKTRNSELTPSTVPSGADLSLVRHFRRRLTHNLITMNRLPLCLKKVEISGLLRHPCLGNPHSLSHSPKPTTHNPANDARLSFVRHLRPTLTSNPCVMSSLSLCPKKGEISALVRHAFPTTHNPQPTTHNPRRPAFPTTHNPQPTSRPAACGRMYKGHRFPKA